MPNFPVTPSPTEARDLRRDRSILALAAALCGALSAAGLAALAVSAQLSTDHHDKTLADATSALNSASDLLDRTRGELAEERQALRCSSEIDERKARHRKGHRKHSKHDKHNRHAGQARSQGLSPFGSQTAALPLGEGTTHARMSSSAITLLAALPVAAVRCDTEDHCQIDRALTEAAGPVPEDSPPLARFVPSIRDGVQLGTKIYGIRSGSPMKLLGFRNGDLIKSVDSRSPKETDSPATNPATTTLLIEFERKGETMKKDIDVL